MSLPISVHLSSATPTMVGFARIVTDTVTHAWLDDRGRGIAGAMINAALEHPAVAGASLQLLLTADAQELYARHGFRKFPDEVTLMARHPGS